MILTSTVSDMGYGEAGVTALLGYAVVFFGLILLMIVMVALGKVFIAADKKKAQAAVTAPAAPATPVEAPKAPGTAGQLKLHNVEPKIAAMAMAIVADKLGKPINELRFISIKEVEQ